MVSSEAASEVPAWSAAPFGGIPAEVALDVPEAQLEDWKCFSLKGDERLAVVFIRKIIARRDHDSDISMAPDHTHI